MATTEFQAKMRSDALKKSQMNPKILMMKKNERIDRNNTIHQNVEPGTLEMFRSENPRVRREASRFLEKIRDPMTKFDEENPNNYDDIHDIRQQLKVKSGTIGSQNFLMSRSVPRQRATTTLGGPNTMENNN